MSGPSKPDDGGSAFPVDLPIKDDYGNTRGFRTSQGMTLRDYFAAKAMALYFDHTTHPISAAEEAYAAADAMLKARSA